MNQIISYVGVEAYPINAEELSSMNYVAELKAEAKIAVFDQMHQSEWEKESRLDKQFTLTKRKQFFHESQLS